MPFLTILAGPNGSGKSTLTGRLKFEGRDNLLDPDAIVRGIDPANPSRAAIAAGREAIQQTREHLRNGQSFGIETTLSAKTRKGASNACANAPDREDTMCRMKTSDGDMNEASRTCLPLRLANEAWLYDNSGDEPRLVLETRDGTVVWRARDEPGWVARARETISGESPAL